MAIIFAGEKPTEERFSPAYKTVNNGVPHRASRRNQEQELIRCVVVNDILVNEHFVVNEYFVTGCELAKIPPSRRQAGKWSRGLGIAFSAFIKRANG